MTSVRDFMKSYRSQAQNGDYAVTWDSRLDRQLHVALAESAHKTYATASVLEIKSATLTVDNDVLLKMMDPEGVVDVLFQFRIHQIFVPAAFTAKLPFLASDLDTLEKIDATIPPVSC